MLSSCDYIIPLVLNYRITVEVETPEGIKSGSAVRKVVATRNLAFNPDIPAISSSVSGEAVVIDLGKQGVLFALLNWSSFEEVYQAFPFDGYEYKPEWIRYYRKLKSGTKAELKKHLPKIVTFTDLDNPMSVKLVRGWRFNVETQKHDLVDDFEETIGKGVRLKQVTIEITNDPITWGVVEKLLPWLEKIGGGYLHGGMTSRNAPLGLHGGNFKTGSK